MQVDPFYSTAKSLSVRMDGSGGSRFSVRMQWPSLAADGLHYIRTAFQFKTKRQHCCEMDYSQQR